MKGHVRLILARVPGTCPTHRILVITLKSQPPPAPIGMNQQHPVFYLAQEAIHYEVSHQLDEQYLCICYNGNQGSILDCQLHHYISCVPNVSIQHSRWSYCQTFSANTAWVFTRVLQRLKVDSTNHDLGLGLHFSFPFIQLHFEPFFCFSTDH